MEKLDKLDWLDWLESKSLSERTLKNYSFYFDKFKWEKISQKYVIRFINKYNNSVAKAFLRNTFHYIQFTDFSEEIKKKVREIEIPKQTGRIKKRIVKTLKKDQILEIVKCMKDLKLKLMLLVTFYGGLRKAELLALKPYDVQWKEWMKDPEDNGVVRIIGKGDKEREVYLPPSVMKALLEWIQSEASGNQTKEDPIFSRNMHERTWEKKLKSASMKAIQEEVNPHRIRHSCATYLLDMGFNIKEIKEYLGHSNIQTTERYLEVRRDDLKSKINRIF